ncbi:MAG: tRNA (cytidine(34)-2'-O)-methyltransferase [Betaproteobacteria bacterium]|nr:tRNA (cytidine(34)-2'-O)-methyltransferase [Betaproteobacteria bacterium]
MFEIVLFEPEIPPNTGNVMRLCANTGCRLHLVRPLGFSLSDKQLERAGMDYRSDIDYLVHDDWERCRATFAGRRLYAVTTKGTQRHDQIHYKAGDVIVFGPETRGLPPQILSQSAAQLRLPMLPASRSLNLANAVAVVIYEAWRQLDFAIAG